MFPISGILLNKLLTRSGSISTTRDKARIMMMIFFAGVVPNIRGRVLSDTSGDPMLLEKGLYVCGWLKRGPTGIIATNLYCAEETVSGLLHYLDGKVLVNKVYSCHVHQ